MSISPQLGGEHRVEIPAGAISYRACGNGSPIVFVHGVGVNGDLWRRVVPRLAGGHCCITPDLPWGSHSLPLKPDTDLSLPEWTLWVGSDSVYRGHDEISAEIDREAPMMEYLNCGVKTIASVGNTVFTERTDRFVCMGKAVQFDLVAVFELNDDEQITTWREYFDSAAVAKSMGVEQEQMTAQ